MKIAITGGSDGLGLELSKYFSEKHNHTIVTCGRREVTEVCTKKYPGIIYKQLDLTASKAPREFIDFVFETLNGVDIFINNAVVCAKENLLSDDRKFFYESFLLNTLVPVELTQELHKRMVHLPTQEKKTSVIMISSETSIQPKSDLATYSATKSALMSYTKTLAMHLKNSRIDVCSIVLGPLATPYYLDLYSKAAQKAEMELETYITMNMNKAFPSNGIDRLITPEEVGKGILFLHEMGGIKNGLSLRLDAGVIPLWF